MQAATRRTELGARSSQLILPGSYVKWLWEKHPRAAARPAWGPRSSSATGETDQTLSGIMGRDEVPEVIAFELRYFDGSSWTSSWDSRAQGRLPVAVEMRFELKREQPDEAAVFSDGETELVDDDLSESNATSQFGTLDEDIVSPSDMTTDSLSESYGGDSILSVPGLSGAAKLKHIQGSYSYS